MTGDDGNEERPPVDYDEIIKDMAEDITTEEPLEEEPRERRKSYLVIPLMTLTMFGVIFLGIIRPWMTWAGIMVWALSWWAYARWRHARARRGE